MHLIGPRSSVAILIAVCALAPAWGAETRKEIGPGPTEILPEEAAIVADPQRGIEHAVVIVDETEWREALGVVVRHRRAKILSAEGRSLADVTFPSTWADPTIQRWWGRTILPDGRVVELPREALRRQAARDKLYRLLTVRATLPGVEPGCVIDYGYELRSTMIVRDRTVMLQQAWPVLDWRLRWQPNARLGAQAVLNRAEHLDIGFTNDGEAFVITGHHLPPVREEPYLPPASEQRASVRLFYPPRLYPDPPKFWAAQSRSVATWLDVFLADERATSRALANMQVDPGQEIGARLRRVYSWIDENIDYRPLRTSEEVEIEPEARGQRRSRDYNTWVLEHRQADGWQLDALFLGFARALGAKAELVLVRDRQKGYWSEAVMDWWQFDDAVVALDLPGTGRQFVDPGSGLPFGQVPWWYTDATAVVFKDGGYEAVPIPVPAVADNLTRSRATIEFDNRSFVLDWSREFSPQAGLLTRRELRQIHPDERADRIRMLCGESNDLEIDTAAAPELDKSARALRLDCRGRSESIDIDDSTERFDFPVSGVWNPSLPDLPSGKRQHPVHLDFPRNDETEVVVRGPDGFDPVDDPPPVNIAGRFGTYRLEIVRTENGYRISRSVQLAPVRFGVDVYRSLSTYLAQVQRADATRVGFKRRAP